MFQDKITTRIHAALKKTATDHGISYREKCRRARETVLQIYRDEELCITENLVKRADFLRGWKACFLKDRFYIRQYELHLIHMMLENLIDSGTDKEPVCTTATELSVKMPVPASVLSTTSFSEVSMPSLTVSEVVLPQPTALSQTEPEDEQNLETGNDEQTQGCIHVQ